MTSKPSSLSTASSAQPCVPANARFNYVAIVLGCLVALYVFITIIRPLFFSIRPGKVTQDFGCVSKSVISDCSASSR